MPRNTAAGRDDVTALAAVPGPAAAARRRMLFATGTGARMYRAESASCCAASAAPSASPRSGQQTVTALDAARLRMLNLDAEAGLRDLQDAMGRASPSGPAGVRLHYRLEEATGGGGLLHMTSRCQRTRR